MTENSSAPAARSGHPSFAAGACNKRLGALVCVPESSRFARVLENRGGSGDGAAVRPRSSYRRCGCGAGVQSRGPGAAGRHRGAGVRTRRPASREDARGSARGFKREPSWFASGERESNDSSAARAFGAAARVTYDGLDDIADREGGDVRGSERERERRDRRREDREARHAGGASSARRRPSSTKRREFFPPVRASARVGARGRRAFRCAGRTRGGIRGEQCARIVGG